MALNNEYVCLNLGGGIFHGVATGTASVLIDASTEGVATILFAPRTLTVDEIGMRTATVVGAPSLRVSLQTVTAAGLPSGTILGGTNNGFADFAAWTTNTFHWLTLGESVTITRGDAIALVCEDAPAGQDANASHNIQARRASTFNDSVTPKGPVKATTWAEGTAGAPFYIATRDSADTNNVIGFPISATSSRTIPSGIGNKSGIPFLIPGGGGSLIAVGGSMAVSVTADISIKFGIYEDDSGATPVIETNAFDKDTLGVGAVNHQFYFNGEGVIQRNKKYFFACELQAAGAAVIPTYSAPTNASLAGFAHMGFIPEINENTGTTWAGAAGNHTAKYAQLVFKEFPGGVGGLSVSF